ncbi:Type 1 glutamine amidotransferase-like domain-containing protein [Streptomyces sp. NBC_00289]|uniref:Type 1 glutamine amidotransferase-like domain-containing protein n=1 Tax=Streptomyces sp. NBC_00289 TaxID=2975703 RepID=UPI003243FB15
MSSRTFLIGGGWDPAAAAAVYGPFLRAAGDAPRIGCVVVDEGDGAEQFARYEAVLRVVDADCAAVPLLVPLGKELGEQVDVEAVSYDVEAVSYDVDGVLVCGGLTPAYQEALRGGLPRLLAARGIPYAGFSAGAAVAAERALVGGWLSDGVAVCPEDAAEDLEEVEVRAGLGLVPFAVDVHAAQWGTLPRLITAVARDALPHGVAIDENTVLDVDADGGLARVFGHGRAHSVRPAPGADGGVLVRSFRAGESFTVR